MKTIITTIILLSLLSNSNRSMSTAYQLPKADRYSYELFVAFDFQFPLIKYQVPISDSLSVLIFFVRDNQDSATYLINLHLPAETFSIGKIQPWLEIPSEYYSDSCYMNLNMWAYKNTFDNHTGTGIIALEQCSLYPTYSLNVFFHNFESHDHFEINCYKEDRVPIDQEFIEDLMSFWWEGEVAMDETALIESMPDNALLPMIYGWDSFLNDLYNLESR